MKKYFDGHHCISSFPIKGPLKARKKKDLKNDEVTSNFYDLLKQSEGNSLFFSQKVHCCVFIGIFL